MLRFAIFLIRPVVVGICLIGASACDSSGEQTLKAAAKMRSYTFSDGRTVQETIKVCAPEATSCVPDASNCWFKLGDKSVRLACASTGEEFGLVRLSTVEIATFLNDYALYAGRDGCNADRWSAMECDGKIHTTFCGSKLTHTAIKPTISDSVYCLDDRVCNALFRSSDGAIFGQSLTADARSAPRELFARKSLAAAACPK